jgi:hypothetical protein
MYRRISGTTLILGLILCILSAFSCLYSFTVNQSDSESFWIPNSLTIDLSADGKYSFSDGFGIDSIRLWNELGFTHRLSLVAVAESRVGINSEWDEWNERDNKLTQVYFRYNRMFSLLSYGVYTNSKIGMLERYPRFTDPLLIIENHELYFRPERIWGISTGMDARLGSFANLSIHTNLDSGDLSSNKPRPDIPNLYLRFRPEIYTDFGIAGHVGRIEGSKYLVGECFVYYSPTFFEDLETEVRLGKLAGRDETPYGVHFSVKKAFKYVSIGGFYQRRFNQPKGDKILGFYLSFISPKPLVDFMNLYRPTFDTNTNTLRANIPFFSAIIGRR